MLDIKIFWQKYQLGVIFCLSIFIAGCAGMATESASPAELLKTGKSYLRVNNYEDARTVFNQILEEAPDSRERIMALRLLADSYYKEEFFEEAKLSYRKFRELYPTNKYADHALYYQAMSDFRQVDIAARDQSRTHNALEEFNQLIADFPKSPFAKKAVPKIKKCTESIASNLMEIGKYYFRTQAFQAAISRFKSLLENYPKQKFEDEAIFLIAESYYREQNYRTAKKFYLRLLKKFPKSEYAIDTRKRLKRS
ncbi:MAG: outer membrane protein assembly factor BamD [Nitrospinales bacterium]